MSSKLLTISQTAKMLGVSIQTLRRWDDANKLSPIRKSVTGNRYYTRDDIDNYIKNNKGKLIFKLAKSWITNDLKTEFYSDFYCLDSSVFQGRLTKLESGLGEMRELGKMYPLISAIVGEIGNNSFDHNLGKWPDIPGIFFAYDLNRKKIALADRGQGILKTLKKVKPKLSTHLEALDVGFNEVISGRAPEYRGNGLKFVRNVVADNKISLIFHTGDAKLRIDKSRINLNIKKTNIYVKGCLALIKF
jgi:hypothetical protein|tara:strand:- start:19688 stop:20428 length:741 start_codon:yes stop_codon:yes gene_type:complete